MTSIAAYPKKKLGEPETIWYQAKGILLIIQSVVTSILLAWFIQAHSKTSTLFDLGHMYITLFLGSMSSIRYLIIKSKRYKQISADYLKSFHLIYHKHESKYAMETHIYIHRICHFFTMYSQVFMYMGMVFFNIIPLYKNYSAGLFSSHPPANVTFEHSVYYQLPFDYQTDKKGYFIISSYNLIVCYCCSVSICSIDLFISLQVLHIWGHLNILKRNFETLQRPTDKLDAHDRIMFSLREMVRVVKQLEDCIEHHNYILVFINKFSKVYGPIVFVYHMFHQITCCLLLLLCSQFDPDVLIQYGPLTVIIFQQLIQISVVFELIGSMSDKLTRAVYDMPWECMDSKGRLLVLIMLIKLRTPLRLKALGMLDVGVKTMVSILKNSLSFFAFLRRTNI